jgi:hypothetical protein
MRDRALDLWARWTFWHILMIYGAFMVGSTLALIAAIATTLIAPASPLAAPLGVAVGGSIGLVVSVTLITGAQWWLVLRHYFTDGHRWFIRSGLASVLGGLFGMGSALLIQRFFPSLLEPVQPAGEYANPELDGMIFGGVITAGIVVSIMQWTVLRTVFKQAVWWIPASLLGGMLSFWLSAERLVANTSVSILLSLGMGAGYGAITGGAMLWLVHVTMRRAEPPNTPL